MSFMDSLFCLFSDCYDNLDFNVHLWFLSCFFLTVVLFGWNFFLSFHNLTTGSMWFVTAFISVAGMILISQLINESKIQQYFGQISLIVFCIYGLVYRIAVKTVSIPL